ncbi:MAG: hypothetical protein ACYCXY_08710, partial [Acidimicrobiales bacterium]
RPARRALRHLGTAPSPICRRVILDRAVCQRCMLRLARNAASCPGYGGSKVLAFYDDAGRAACATCTGNPAAGHGNATVTTASL